MVQATINSSSNSVTVNSVSNEVVISSDLANQVEINTAQASATINVSEPDVVVQAESNTVEINAGDDSITIIGVGGPTGGQGADGAAGPAGSDKTYSNITESQNIDLDDTNTSYSNEGATELCNLTIDENVVGMEFRATVTDAMGIQFTVTNGATIYNAAEESSVNGSIKSLQVGAVIVLSCITTTKWIVSSQQRTWILS